MIAVSQDNLATQCLLMKKARTAIDAHIFHVKTPHIRSFSQAMYTFGVSKASIVGIWEHSCSQQWPEPKLHYSVREITQLSLAFSFLLSTVES